MQALWLRSRESGEQWKLSLLALGVVYGDIGTSPLYALRECFVGHGLRVQLESVLGVVSLIFWSLASIVSFKYLRYVLEADNHGEGGILALMALARSREQRPLRRGWILALGIAGAALLYGDGAITPAISVLGAVEGLTVAAPHLQYLIVPVTCLILLALFVVQRRGTAALGAVFGPITLTWFCVLAVLGVRQIAREPGILRALNPWYAISFLATGQQHGFLVLGAVFLAVTGAEALYADLGHFGNLEHNHVLHENIVFLSIVTETSSRVPERDRMRIEALAPGVWRMVGHYGFMDHPDAPDLLLHSGLINGLREATFFLGQEHFLVGEGGSARHWRMLLFSVLSRLAQPATLFFNIPPARVMEVGIQIVL